MSTTAVICIVLVFTAFVGYALDGVHLTYFTRYYVHRIHFWRHWRVTKRWRQ